MWKDLRNDGSEASHGLTILRRIIALPTEPVGHITELGIDDFAFKRGHTYGAARGAPQAEQVADRWHRCKNVGDALEQAVLRLRISLPTKPLDEPPRCKEEAASPARESVSSARTQRFQATLQRKQEQADRIKEVSVYATMKRENFS